MAALSERKLSRKTHGEDEEKEEMAARNKKGTIGYIRSTQMYKEGNLSCSLHDNGSKRGKRQKVGD